MVAYSKNKLIKFVKENKELILDGNLDRLYLLAIKSNIQVYELTQFLVDCGVDPLDYVTETVAGMFYRVTLPEQLKKLKLNNSVTVVDDNVFFFCENLESIDLNNVSIIGNWAFASCNALKSINLKNVIEIGEWAFSGCTELPSVDLSSIKTIGQYAFNNCAKLKTIYAPKNVNVSTTNPPASCQIICV